MPLYSFKCIECGHQGTEFMQMRNSVPVGEFSCCPECGLNFYLRQVDLPHTDLKQFDKPIEMHSVAATEWSELREIQRKCPDVQISDDPSHPDFGVPIVKNRKEKLQVLAATEYREVT